MFEIVCVGIVVADVIAKPVDKIPEKGKLGVIEKITMHTGGCAVNTAIDLAKIGISTAVLAKIGNDGFGGFLLSELSKSGVETTGIKVSPYSGTSASVVLVDQEGERSFIHTFGANADFTYNDIDFDIIKKSKILFVGGTMLMPSFDGEPCAKVLKKAQCMGKITVLDVAWDSYGRWMNVLRPCMEYIDYFMPSYEEAVQLSGKEDPEEIADVFLAMGVKTVVIKLGKDGCFIKDKGGEKFSIPIFDCVECLDTTGAGDSFVAGFLAGLSEGYTLYNCGIFANAVGAHCVMAVGASTGIKPMEEIQQFIKTMAVFNNKINK